MFAKRIRIFTLFGFEVNVDLSWVVIAVLIVWSLASGFFPRYYQKLPAQVYLWMGVAGAIGLFLSVVFHEFFHSIVARHFGLPMKGITLFIFGGVAEMTEEPANPKIEFLMAVAGPASSVVLGAIFYAILSAGISIWIRPVAAVLGYLAMINWSLAVFNLLPAFPLDGGRMLRSALWKWKGDIKWATRRASSVGSMFGILLISLGLYGVVFGNLISGIWLFLIGMFLRGAAQASYEQILIRRALEGTPVRKIMEKNPVTVSSRLTILELVEAYIYKYHFKMFPVVDNGKLFGCITTRQVQEVPRQEWAIRKVGEITTRCPTENTIGPDYDAIKAMGIIDRTGNSRLMVVEDGALVGVLSNKDLIRHLSLKLDLLEKEKIKAG